MTRKDRPWYEFIDHTADVGLRLGAPDLPSLFEIAGTAFFDLLTDRSKVAPAGEHRIELTGGDVCELLVTWFQELIYLNEVHGWLFYSFEMIHAGETSVEAVARGETFNAERHEIRTLVKAATYHDLVVKRVENGLEASVILDT